MLAPMPLAISMGVGSNTMPLNVAEIQNTNGQAITLHVKHKDKRDPKMWKGFKFAVPFEYSMHNFLLRYYVAEHGLDPDKDIQIRVVPPPEMVANLRAGNLDGFLSPDPFNQRAVYDEVGFIHILSKDIWDGHPCCSFAAPTQFVTENPNTFTALYRSILTASAMGLDPKNRTLMAEVLSPANYLNQPKTVLEQVLTGKFADGLGGVKDVPDRINFEPFPWYSMAVWILSQMKRWGYIKGDVRYKDIAEKVYLLTEARKRMAEVGKAFVKYLAHPFYDNGPNDKGIGIQLGHSLARVGLGFLLAVLIALPLGFAIGMSPLLLRALDPFIQILKPISPLAWMPLALYTLKDSSVSGIFVIFICSVWPMLINTAFGVASVRRDWLNVARTLEVSPLRKAFLVILPAAAPTILTGMRISMGIAWLVIVAAEMLVGGTGIGYFVWNEWNNLSIANIVTAILLIGVVGLLLDQMLASLAKLVTYPE